MVKHICIHSPKVFIQSWISVTQLGKRKTRGYVNQEIGIQNINTFLLRYTIRNKTRIYITRIRKYTHRWWYINKRIRPPPKYNS